MADFYENEIKKEEEVFSVPINRGEKVQFLPTPKITTKTGEGTGNLSSLFIPAPASSGTPFTGALKIRGSYTIVNTDVTNLLAALDIDPTVTSRGAAISLNSAYIKGSITRFSSGAHPVVAALSLGPPVDNGGAATVTNAATLYITGETAFTATGDTDYAVFIDSGNSRFDGRILKAKGANVASGGTITLGSDGNYFNITGTTTINFITTSAWTAGSVIILQFDSALTVTHNAAAPPANTAAILLSGAVNFSATANDTLQLVYDSTTWREVSRTVI